MKNSGLQAKKGVSAASVNAEKYLTFLIDGQLYTVPSSQIVEIIRMQPITFMPNVTSYVKGIINLRGKVVPVIDMRLRFGKEAKEFDARSSIVIVEQGELTVGLIVDFVKDVRGVLPEQINPSPCSRNQAEQTGKDFVCGIVTLENESAMLLDTAKVLTHHDESSHASSTQDTSAEEAAPAVTA